MSVISEKTGFQIRPRFEVASKYSVTELQDIMKKAIKSKDAPCDGKVRYGYVSLFPKEEDHHYWSPHLSVTIEEIPEEEGSLLRGLYGPSPAVWTMFVFVYGIIALSIVIALVIGQKKGHDQIEDIHHFFEFCIGQTIE